MKVVQVHSLPTELWYPYGRLRGTNGDQSIAGSCYNFADRSADCANYLQLYQVNLGL